MTAATVARPQRVCVLGNSHVGAWRLGWETVQASVPDVQPTFFASPGRSLADLELRGDRLVPTRPVVSKYLTLTSGGAAEIAVGEFDACVLVGMALLLPQVDRRHSLAVLRAACEDAWAQSVSARLVMLIRACSALPLLVVHNPLPTARPATPGLTRVSYAETLDCMQAGAVPPGVTLLPQSAQTRLDDWCTRTEYASGATTLLGDGVADDNATHMNAQFGALQWRAALERLRELVPNPA